MSTLPPPQQVWSHGTCSGASLTAALNDGLITAIESDILMSADSPPVPIMSHPPCRTSDLTFERFLSLTVGKTNKHLKLDFKEIEALALCVSILANQLETTRSGDQHVWLNADIISGPGCRQSDERGDPFDANEFFRLTLPLVSKFPNVHLSLGWKVHVVGGGEFTDDDVARMGNLIQERNIDSVVFAVCARLAAYNFDVLSDLLHRFPKSQILLWTGTGEPPLSPSLFHALRENIASKKLNMRVGFDVAVANGVLAGAIATAKVAFASYVRWLLGARFSPW
jgi:hypothetical protein